MLLNLGRKRKLSQASLFIMFISGLRGAVAFALAIDSPHYTSVFVTTTLVVVFTTTIIFGGAAYPSLKALSLINKTNEEMTKEEVSNHWWVKFDRSYLIPFFRVPRRLHRLTMDKMESSMRPNEANAF